MRHYLQLLIGALFVTLAVVSYSQEQLCEAYDDGLLAGMEALETGRYTCAQALELARLYCPAQQCPVNNVVSAAFIKGWKDA